MLVSAATSGAAAVATSAAAAVATSAAAPAAPFAAASAFATFVSLRAAAPDVPCAKLAWPLPRLARLPLAPLLAEAGVGVGSCGLGRISTGVTVQCASETDRNKHEYTAA